MKRNKDQVKGTVEQAVGSATDDETLKADGRIDSLAGDAKAKVSHLSEQIEHLVDKAKDALHKK